MIQEEMGSRGDSIEALLGLARAALAQQELVEARRRCQQSLSIPVALRSRRLVPECLEVAGMLLAAQGRAFEADELWGTAEALREELGTPPHPVERADYDGAVAAAREQLGEEAFARAWERGRITPVEQVIATVLKMEAK